MHSARRRSRINSVDNASRTIRVPATSSLKAPRAVSYDHIDTRTRSHSISSLSSSGRKLVDRIRKWRSVFIEPLEPIIDATGDVLYVRAVDLSGLPTSGASSFSIIFSVDGEQILTLSFPCQKANVKLVEAKASTKVTLPASAETLTFDFIERTLQGDKSNRTELSIRSLLPYETLHEMVLPLIPKQAHSKTTASIHLKLYLFHNRVRSPGRRSPSDSIEAFHAIPIFNRVHARDILGIMEILDQDSSQINAQDPRSQETPVFHAAVQAWQNEYVILYLLEQRNIRIDVRNIDGNSPLHVFCSSFYNPLCHEAFARFLEKGADVNSRNNNEETPLHKAIFNTRIRMLLVQLLLDAGADVNARSSRGGTPLHYAIHLNRQDVLQIFVENGADLSIRDDNGDTVLDVCEHSGLDALAKAITEYNVVMEIIQRLDLLEFKSALLKIRPDRLQNLTDRELLQIGLQDRATRETLSTEFRSMGFGLPRKPPSAVPGPDDSEEGRKHLDELLQGIDDGGGRNWKILPHTVEFIELIGSGAAGKVYRGLHEGKTVAIKVLNASSAQEVDEFVKEFAVIQAIQSENVVKLYGAIRAERLSMVMEFCARGSLFDLLSKAPVEISWMDVFKLMLQICRGLEAIHSKKVLHRDLKSLNILLTETGDVRICDFGLSRFDTSKNITTLGRLRGTYAYTAPEIYFGELFTVKSDIFSLGIVLWELVYRCVNRSYQYPYAEYPELKMDFQIIIKTAKSDLRPTMPRTPTEMAALIRSCWSRNPSNRPTVGEVYEEIGKFRKDYQEWPTRWDNLIVDDTNCVVGGSVCLRE